MKAMMLSNQSALRCLWTMRFREMRALPLLSPAILNRAASKCCTGIRTTSVRKYVKTSVIIEPIVLFSGQSGQTAIPLHRWEPRSSQDVGWQSASCATVTPEIEREASTVIVAMRTKQPMGARHRGKWTGLDPSCYLCPPVCLDRCASSPIYSYCATPGAGVEFFNPLRRAPSCKGDNARRA